MRRLLKREEGQSILIIAGALIVLVALIGLVADAGNAYVQRRKVQNAMDAGAQAGAIALGFGKTNDQIDSAIDSYVRNNGVDPINFGKYYVVQNADRTYTVYKDQMILNFGYGNNPPTTINVGGSNLPVAGVQVEGDKVFNTFFAGVVGWNTMQVHGGAAAFMFGGACSADGLFPIAFAESTFTTYGIHLQNDDPSYRYRIWMDKLTAPGNFGYATWVPGDTSDATLVANMTPPSDSGTWQKGDWLPGAPGIMDSSGVANVLDTYYIGKDPPKLVTIPVYNAVDGTGSNTRYKIVAFAEFEITGYNFQGSDKYIEGKLYRMVDPASEGGCASYGVSSVKLRPPLDSTRQLLGVVKVAKLTPVTMSFGAGHVPIDVIHVADSSETMSQPFGGSTKIQELKTALTAPTTGFNNLMLPAQGDQIGLVLFPNALSGSSYTYRCPATGPWTTYYWGHIQNALTNNVSAVNTSINALGASGRNPIADGIRAGREAVLGTGHISSHPAVMIIVSSGIPNVLPNGQWTGYPGASTSNTLCNAPATQAAIDQGNVSKGDGSLGEINKDGLPDVTVFSIALGSNWDSSWLEALATFDRDTSKPHFYKVSSTTPLSGKYQEIANRLLNFQANESCTTVQSEALAANATLNWTNSNGHSGSVTTTSTGQYTILNAENATYQFNSGTVTLDGVTYNIFSDGVGGPKINGNPSIAVGSSSGTYTFDLALKTLANSNPLPSCPAY